MDELRSNQEIVREWVESRLGVLAMDRHERALRLTEEVIELSQSLGVDFQQVVRIALHVYEKPKGNPIQELGGVGVTALACASSLGEDLLTCINMEIRRIHELRPSKFVDRQRLNAELGIGAPPP